MSNISNSIPKVDHLEKVSGKAIYVNDYQDKDYYYAKTIRSSVAHGKIKHIHKPELPKNYNYVDHTDILDKNVVAIIEHDMPVFATDEVHYIGEPIFLIVGPDKQVISELEKQFIIDYEVLDAVFDDSHSGVHYDFSKGKPEQAFKEADRIITHTYETGYQEQLYIETQGLLGDIHEGKVTIIGSLQCPYYVKNAVLHTLGCKADQVQIIQSAVGGAFGGKEEFPSLMACQLATALHKIKQPIKLIYDREEDVIVSTKRHPSKTTLSAAIKNHRISALKVHVDIDGGAYIGLSGVVLSRALIASTGVYTIDHVDVTGDVLITNTVPTGAFRGFGAPQMFFAIEMFIQHVAKTLNEDVLSFRLKHLAKQHDRTSTNGEFRDPILMEDMIAKAMEMSSYQKKHQKYDHPDIFKGIGMSWFLHGCGFTGSGESTHIKAVVKLHKHKDNQVEVLIAAVDMGQGVKTTMQKIVSKALNIPLEQVTFNNPDTDRVPDSGPTVASRTMMIVGGLVARAALQLKQTWKDHEEQIVEQHYQQPEYIKWDEKTFQGDAYPAYSWGVNVVEVEVSKVTYQVKIVGSWSVYDIGKAIDERIILGQADGGQLQGLAYGYLEVMNHKEGRLLQHNVTDYIIPTAVDAPPTKTVLFDNPYPLGPYGAKGAGELPLVGGAPAVALAIEQAISKKVNKIPVTSETILELMSHD